MQEDQTEQGLISTDMPEVISAEVISAIEFGSDAWFESLPEVEF